MGDFPTTNAAGAASSAPAASLIGPRAKLLYLAGTAVAAFCLRRPAPLGALLALQAALWAWSRVPLSEAGRLARRLWLFVLMMVLTFGLFPARAAHGEVWRAFAAGPWTVRLNETGLRLALLMSLRLLAVVAASTVVHAASRPADYVEGLRGWLPETAALAMASTLALINEDGGGGGERQRAVPAALRKGGGGRGRGDGSGGGRGGQTRLGYFDALKRLARGEGAGGFVEALESSLTRARARANAVPSALPRERAEDAAVVAGIAVLMLSTKLARILPGVPFAPGFKVMLLVPLYILAASLTRLRAPATTAGLIVGVLSFLAGDGRFGVFEILKQVTPGLMVDLGARWVRGGCVSTAACAGLGFLAGAARAATILAVTAFVQGNALLYGFAALQAASRLAFGVVGGLVAAAVLKELARLKGTPAES